MNLSFRMVRSCLISFFVLIFVAGCGAVTSRLAHFPPSAEIFITQGNFAYSRLDYQKAWEAYRKAEALGVRSAVVSYRLDLLGGLLDIEPSRKEAPLYRAQTIKLLKEAYAEGKAKKPVIFRYFATVLESSQEGGKDATRLYAEAVRRYEKKKFGRLNAGDLEVLARMYLSLGLQAPAEKLLLKAQRLNSRYALVPYSLGKIYALAGNHLKAIRQFELFLDIVPSDLESHILLGQSVMASGDYTRAKQLFETALSLDSANSEARQGHQRAIRAVERSSRLKGQAQKVGWEVGYSSRMVPLTLEEDHRDFRSTGTGPPSFGPGGKLSLVFGDGARFQVYTVTKDGMNLARQTASSSGFSSFTGYSRFLVTNGYGPGRVIGEFDSSRGTFSKIHRGHCEQPNFSQKDNALLCVAPQGILLVKLGTGKVRTLFRETDVRHPRFSDNAQMIAVAKGDSLIWFDRSGQVQGRVRLPGGTGSASYPVFSPDGRWLISGESGLHLTSVKERISVERSHPSLKDAGRAVFNPVGESLVFGRAGRWFQLDFPKRLAGFFAVMRARALLREKKYGAAARLLKDKFSGSRNQLTFHVLRAKSLFGLKFYRQAEESAARAADLDKRDWRPVLLLGKIKASQGYLEDSIHLLDRSIELGPDQFDGYFERARIRALQGFKDEAVEDYRFALKRVHSSLEKDGEAAVMALLGLYVEKERQNDALLLLLNQADRLGPNAIRDIHVAPRFESLRVDPRFGEIMAPAAEVPTPPKKMPPPIEKSPPQKYAPRKTTTWSRAHRPQLHASIFFDRSNSYLHAYFEESFINKEVGVNVFW
ncbi:MAG: hypothetical protein HOG94_13985 [Nitrospinaceae bacterium]|nr:hypothetical protein [Nitrospinaceae bacterium]